MAPEMVECETSTAKTTYDSKVDVWSFAITMIELADTSPPWQDLHPMRALLKIVKSEAPSLADPHKWSELFYDFLYVALDKDPSSRQVTALNTLQHTSVRERASARGRERESESEREGGMEGGRGMGNRRVWCCLNADADVR